MAQAQFEATVAGFFEEFIRRHPVEATSFGIHAYDEKLPEASRAAIKGTADLTRGFRERVAAVDPNTLTPSGRVDREVALTVADLALFDLEERRMAERASEAAETLGSALYLLVARDFAPLPERMRAVAARLEAAPRFLTESRALVTRPVRLWNQIALDAAAELPRLLRTIVQTAREKLADRSLLARVGRAADGAEQALRGYSAWLRDDVIPKGSSDVQLGPGPFERLLRLRRLGLSADQILALGERSLAELTERRVALAAKIRPAASVDEVLREVKSRHPGTFAEALEAYREAVREARAFVIERDVASVPRDETLLVEETPGYLRHIIPFAAYVPPGKYDARQVGIYLVTPDDGGPGGLLEHSFGAIANTSVHEGYPGHHLQLLWANRHPSVIRLLANGTEFIEGWGLYVEELMSEVGFRTSLENQLIMVNDLLWRAVRIVLDVKLATGMIGVDEAVNALVEVTGMDRGAATAEVKRYTLTPGQPLSYLLGKHLLLELREEAKRRLGPKFTMRGFHDALLRAGSLPIAFMRDALETELYSPPIY